MSIGDPAAIQPRRGVPPAFGRIVCSVDGSRSSSYAVQQAITLSTPKTALVFACVRCASGAGATQSANITTKRARAALERAERVAREAEIEAAAEILTGRDPAPPLLEEASRADLLVVAAHGGSRAEGIMLGEPTATAVHRSTVPVLVARRPPAQVTFPQRILVASDGSADAHRAVEIAARIARRHASQVYLLSVDPAPHGRAEQVAAEAVDLAAALGVEPSVVRAYGHADQCILETARADDVSLVVLGSRGLTGLRALGSVSERVATRAPCPVLVARHA